MQIKESLSIEQLNKYILNYITATIKEVCSDEKFGTGSLPLRCSTIKLKSEDKESDIIIRVTADKDKAGMLRHMNINIIKI